MRIVGMCKVTGGAVPAYTLNSGMFGAITHNGNGDDTIVITPPQDATESVFIVQNTEAYAASGVTQCSVTRPADGTIRVYCAREAGAGGASVASNRNYQIVAFSRRGVYAGGD